MIRRPRSTVGRRREGRLVWQAALIVPPVIILSVLALYSLRRDRASIEEDARRNASVLAPELARRWGARAGADLARLVAAACSSGEAGAKPPADRTGEPGPAPICALVVNGRIRVPADYPSLPSPPEWPLDLAPAEARAWRQVADAPPGSDPAALRRASAALATASPPVRLNAEWTVLRAELGRGDAPAAVASLIDLAGRSAEILTESGAPLPDLALLVALRHQAAAGVSDAFLDALRRHVIESPSFLTAALVEETGRRAPGKRAAAAIRARWTASERALALLRGERFETDRASEVWLGTGRDAWLALVRPIAIGGPADVASSRSAYHVTLVPAGVLQQVFTPTPAEAADIPAYASVTITLASRSWGAGRPRSSSAELRRLASATSQFELPLVVPADTVSRFAGELLRVAPDAMPLGQQAAGGTVRLVGLAGAHPFGISLELDAADRLYASYRLRLWTAAGLVFVAMLAVAAGLAGAWRAFERQRRLGEMKSNFVASVSHEFRAPIAAMRLMTESLERGTVEEADRKREYLRAIQQECRRLSSLVENVLDFSRMDRGVREYTFQPADLETLVAATAELMRPSAEERQVRLFLAPRTPDGRLPQPRVDREALQQALMNLVDNAIKHSPAGSDVNVGLETGQSAIRIFVEDTGPGIAVEEQSRIFEPFYRGGSELRRETRGVGIGLSIARQIVEAHGGRVVVRSAPGSGSRFTIELPITSQAPQ